MLKQINKIFYITFCIFCLIGFGLSYPYSSNSLNVTYNSNSKFDKASIENNQFNRIDSNPKLTPKTSDFPNRITLNYITHSAISITSDGGFAGFPGSGTKIDPYIIEGFNFSGGTNPVSISNTQAYFIFRNNIVSNAYYGVYLNNVTNGLIDSNTFSLILYYDFYVISSYMNTLSNNTILQNSERGFLLSGSSYNLITKNTVLNCTTVGIELYSNSNYNKVSYNIVKKNLNLGIYVVSSLFNQISSNYVIDTRHQGVYVAANANYTIVQYNNFINNNIGNSQGYDDGIGNIFRYNYWNEWTTPDSDANGIVDNPYTISGTASNTDPYPFTGPRDILCPDVSHPSDLVYSEGSTGNLIVWLVGDKSPNVYNVTLDWNLFVSTKGWANGSIPINVDGLSLGKHSIIINVYDFNGNPTSDMVLVTVIDNIAPSVTHPSDFSYNEGSSGNTISWTALDLHPNNYYIYKNGTFFYFGYWSTSGPIIGFIDGLSIGMYNFTIVVYDTSGNFAKDMVIVKVIDVTPPIITNLPNNVSYFEGSKGNSLTWTLLDMHPEYYQLLINGIKTGPSTNWINGTISVNIDGLSTGSNNVTIIVFDSSYNYATNSVFVNVKIDTTIPYVSKPADIKYDFGSTGNYILWKAGDQTPNFYNVSLDLHTYIGNTPWSNGTIKVNIDGLAVGVYNFTIFVTDYNGNWGWSSVIVTVNTANSISSSNPNAGNNNTGNSSSSPSSSNILPASFLSFPFGYFAVLGIMTVIIIRKRINNSKLRK